jgi:hypothetical protein
MIQYGLIITIKTSINIVFFSGKNEISSLAKSSDQLMISWFSFMTAVRVVWFMAVKNTKRTGPVKFSAYVT